jgi:hypothetical protein
MLASRGMCRNAWGSMSPRDDLRRATKAELRLPVVRRQERLRSTIEFKNSRADKGLRTLQRFQTNVIPSGESAAEELDCPNLPSNNERLGNG